jgi:hypothetical protein
MTGEMFKPEHAEKGEAYWKDKSGTWGRVLGDDAYCIRPNYPDYFALADSIKKKLHIKASVEPFDVYQGPYVHIGGEVKLGNAPYQVSIGGMSFWKDEEGMWIERHGIGIGSMSEPIEIGDDISVIDYLKEMIKKAKSQKKVSV